MKLSLHILITTILFLLIGTSYGFYFYLQKNNEQIAKSSLLTNQEARENDIAIDISQGIQSDMKMILASLNGLAYSKYLQEGQLAGNNTKILLQNTYDQINSTIDSLFLLDREGIIKSNIVPKGENEFIGTNISKVADWVGKTIISKKPFFSGAYLGPDKKYHIGVTTPIINLQTKELIGVAGVLVPTNRFFSHYENIHNITSESFVAFDNNGIMLANPRTQFIGKSVFGTEIQQFFYHDPIYNRVIKNAIILGRLDEGVYNIPSGQYLITTNPIKFDGKTIYAIGVITPTNQLYSNINYAMGSLNKEITLLILLITIILLTLIVLLLRWQKDVKKEVKSRTDELQKVNQKLEVLNKELASNEKAIKEFIFMLSHELRTPLMPIKIYANLLLRPNYMGSINSKTEKAIKSILRNITSLENIVNDVLDIYRLGLNKFKIYKDYVDINDLIKQVKDDFISIIENDNKNIELKIEFKISDIESKICCDPQRIKQVLGNLIRNSIDFVPVNDGIITIRVERYTRKEENNQSDKMLFTIEDNGTGIPYEKISELFNKFYQINTAITRKPGGTGLGLAICKGIIESHGGRIWIESDYNNGTSIKFTLPLRDKEDK